MYNVDVIADSISRVGIRITTLQLRYWRAVHAEFMTHRVFSRNASSSRAIPVEKMLKQVWNDPAGPLHWGQNRAGMQAHSQLTGWRLRAAGLMWLLAARAACCFAWVGMKLGLHKQVANRLLEPFQYISVIVTATDWDNFFELRDHPDAQPEIQHLARMMRSAMDQSIPKILPAGRWHLPYVLQSELNTLDIEILRKLSVARCARVSYLTHDGERPNQKKDIALHDKLVVSEPLHASPSEHQAMAIEAQTRFRNFRGWAAYRIELEEQKA